MTPILPLISTVPLVAGLLAAVPADQDPALHGGGTGRGAGQVAPRRVVAEHTAAATTADLRRALGYWTPERMARALPATLLDVPRAALLPPAPPRRLAKPVTKGSRWAAGGAVSRTTGRVFLTMRGSDYVCSAGAVRSRNMDVVVTAGHCVKDGTGAWARNWTFVPGYDEGRRPYGAFTARRMFVPEPWSAKADDSYDLAMVAVAPSEGRHLAEVVGGQDIAFNRPRGTRTFGFGFPADAPYDGRHLVYCAGDPHADPHRQTRDQGIRCDLTAGSSGGPWLSSFDPATGRGVVTSVSSFKYSDDATTMYGPYFGDHASKLFEAAQSA
ncbi:peptidase [Sphaerisporangium rubeum]|uniref:V8-like Glu-specific endopeptidase n=1 Tax=Sphaerisporangium rubeum TaxID=321317 RepID=A0A7X0IID9_9ACTN|nr:hypothetical protein [Sphaerisporangium rubeum]MBB6475224.1 V8-like Glu-specific endopeptidase [Sphaerisporangium rubeum]